MPTVQISAPNSVKKLYRHESNRRIRTVDLNTLAGSSVAGSTLHVLLDLMRILSGKGSGQKSFFGFRAPVWTASQIEAREGLILTPDGAHYLEPLVLVPTAEAHYGHFEIALETGTSDATPSDFYNPTTRTQSNALSDTRRTYTVSVYEVYSTSPSHSSTTTGRIRILEYTKTASHGNINSVTQATVADFDPTLREVTDAPSWTETLLSASARAVKAQLDSLNTLIGQKIPLTQKGIPNGVATLGATGVVPSSQLPAPSATVGKVGLFLDPSPPSGVLYCNGAAISRTSYATLWAWIQDVSRVGSIYDAAWANRLKFGGGNGSTTFNLPDWRGLFLRIAGAHSLYAMADGTKYTGGALLSLIYDAIQGHAHYGSTITDINGASGSSLFSGSWGHFDELIETAGTYNAGHGTPRIGDETRPASVSINVGVYYE